MREAEDYQAWVWHLKTCEACNDGCPDGCDWACEVGGCDYVCPDGEVRKARWLAHAERRTAFHVRQGAEMMDTWYEEWKQSR